MAARRPPSTQRGFTFLELALALLVVGLVSWSAFSAYDVFQDAQDRRAAQDNARHLQGQLRAFALRHGRLPCPDTSAAGTGYENLAAGACAAGSQVGWFPYVSAGLAVPTDEHRARYAVYRLANATASLDADLAVARDRNGDPPGQRPHQDLGHLIVALNTAAGHAPGSTRSYVTGDGGMAGAIDCAANLSQLAAYWLVIPLQDRDGDADRLDAPNTLAGPCAGGPSAPVSAANDDVVLAESPALLAGWLRQNLP
jgi:prepilin-type N-terminal cleavage/methylation domain-containing protein